MVFIKYAALLDQLLVTCQLRSFKIKMGNCVCSNRKEQEFS